MQYFKGDATEKKYDAAGEPILSAYSGQKDLFFDGAYQAGPLGDLIFDNLRSPLSNAIPRDTFRLAFKEIFEAFVKVGTFEAYLTVFKKIFGDDVEVEFVIPAPGHLQINIEAETVLLCDFLSRYIVDDAYLFDEVIDDPDGDNIAFQSFNGFTSQYDLEQMLFEMVPGGIFTEISLTLG